MSTLSLHLEDLRVQSFFIGQPSLQPAEFTDAEAKKEPFTTDVPTMSGCSCVDTCPGGAC